MGINIIAACDQNGLIGINGRIPWYIPEDLQRFKRLTTGNAIIMGRKTWENLPIKPLPDRFNIVISKKATFGTIPDMDITVQASLASALQIAEIEGYQEVFIIGGQRLYEEAFTISGYRLSNKSKNYL